MVTVLNMDINNYVLTQEEQASVKETVFQDRVKILHDYLLTTALPATLICSSILLVGLYDHSSKTVLVSWYVAILAVSLLRIGLLWLYKRNPANGRLHLNLFILGSTIAAVVWGYAGVALISLNNINDLILTLVIIAGITAGASQTLQASRAANFMFIIFATLPISVSLVLEDQRIYLVLSMAIFSYMIFMLELAQKGFIQLSDSMRLRHINTLLVSRLTDTNSHLLNEISEHIKTQEELDYLATHDNLTELPNRHHFQTLFNRALTRSQTKSGKFTVLFIDIDHFKSVNDSYGHYTGDALLYQVAGRLKKNLRSNDTIARVGGDEFVILLEHTQDGEEFIEEFVNRLHRAFSTPFHVHKHTLTVTLSMGISIYPDDGETKNVLLKKADIALYRAKDKGRNRTEFYEHA